MDTDNLKDLLKNDPVPDPGEGYWRDFGPRVSARIDLPGRTAAEGRAPARTAARLLPVAAAAALFLLALSIPRPGSEQPAAAHARIPAAGVSAARTTARLADNPGTENAILILKKTAEEKAGLAVEAFRRGDIESLAPAVRSWERIIRTGIIGNLRKAGQDDDDIEPFAGRILDSTVAAHGHWRDMAAVIVDGEAGEALLTAIDAAETLESSLGDGLE